MKKKRKKLSSANQSLINKFKFYLRVEKGLSENTFSSYTHDVRDFAISCDNIDLKIIGTEKVVNYINHLFNQGGKDSTVARKISSLKNFYRFLYSEKIIQNPIFEQFPSPKISMKLPNVFPWKR